MPFLRSNARRDARNAANGAAELARRGLPSTAELFDHSERPSGEWEAVAAALRNDEWAAAQQYLASCRTWDQKYVRLIDLGKLAGDEDSWLRRWQSEQPDDPDAASVAVDGFVKLAWNIRSSARATAVGQDRWAGFFRSLTQAAEAAERAVAIRRNDSDPSPWLVQLWLATGQEWPHHRMQALWAEIVSRDSHNTGAHRAALQYWCEKWHGSHPAMFDFAERAAASAPVGSLLPVLPLVAHHERAIEDEKDGYYKRTRDVTRALAMAADAVNAARHDDPHLVFARNHLAYAYLETGDHASALNQFAAIGARVDGPWLYYGNPLVAFDRARVRAAGAVASRR